MRNAIATGLILFAGFLCGALFRINGGVPSAVGQSPLTPTSRDLGGNTNQPSALAIAQPIQIPNGNPAGGGPVQGLLFPDADLGIGEADFQRHLLQRPGERQARESMLFHQELRRRAFASAGEAGEADEDFRHAICSDGKLTQPEASRAGGSSSRMVL